MRNNREFRLPREVYLIIGAVVLLGLAMVLAGSPYALRLGAIQLPKMGGQKFQPVQPSSLASSEAPFCTAFVSGDEGSVKTGENARMVLQYMKKPVRMVDLSEESLDFAHCQAVIASVTFLGQLGDLDALGEYVRQGGYVFLTHTPEIDDAYYRLYRKLGIYNNGDYTEEKGIKLTSGLLLGEKGLIIDDEFITNLVLSVELDSSSRVYAETPSGIPLLWERPYGEGKFMVFNGWILQEKLSRGLLAGAISRLMPDFIYPIFNARILFIDDFPAPIPQGTHDMIYELYYRNNQSFFRDIWWPQMLKLAKQHNFRFTSVFVQTYNDRVDPPFAHPEDENRQVLISYGREVLKSGGELGMHGYNHQSLQMSQEVADSFGYNAWPSIENMEAAAKEALAFFRSAFPRYAMHVYVPPSNVFSPEGREALKRAWPNLTVISSLYREDATGTAYVQEFEIAEDGILEMPRVSSGFLDLEFERWAVANVMTTHGIFSHFMHPDDLLDEERNGNFNWEELHLQFSGVLERVDQKYPWLRPMTASEAAADIAGTLAARVDWHRENGSIRGEMDHPSESMYFILRTDKRIGNLRGCKIREIDEETYLVHAYKSEFEIELRE